MRINRNNGVLNVKCEAGTVEVGPTDDDGRIFNPVPGFSFVPLRILPDSEDKKVLINIYFY